MAALQSTTRRRAATKGVAHPPASVAGEGILAMITRVALALDAWLGGPPLTQRELVRHKITTAERELT